MMTIFALLAAFGLPTGPEFWFLIILVLLLFGAKRLPTLARSIGKSIHEFRRAKNEFETEIERAGEEAEKEADLAKARTSNPSKTQDS
jgi:sec-independent protein translocase protein TatA